MADNQLQNQLTRFLKRGRNRRERDLRGYQPVDIRSVKTVPRPVKRGRKV